MTIAGIYRLTDNDGNVYIGSSVNINRRKNRHFRDLKNQTHRNTRLQRAYNKYGAQYFSFSIVEVVNDLDILLNREQAWLDYVFNNLPREMIYNTVKIAGNITGYKHTDRARKAISIGLTGKELSIEHRRSISEGHAKTYTLLSPNNEVVEITNLKRFCDINGYNQGSMSQVVSGRRKSAHGWRLWST